MNLNSQQDADKKMREFPIKTPVVLITDALTGIGRATGYGMSLAYAGDLRPRRRVCTFLAGPGAGRLNPRRLLDLLSAANHGTPPCDGTGVEESNFNGARSGSDWSGHAGSAR